MGGGLKRTKLSYGFTIVELLIVIIVIAILATLVITAYNGVQTKAKNTKTVAAVEAWVKAINLYHADTGDWPSTSSCLGNTDTYVGDSGLCQAYASPYWTVKSAFLTEIGPYIGKPLPEPDTAKMDDFNRGALYFANSNPKIYWVDQSGSCSLIGGLHDIAVNYSASDGIWCYGNL